MVGRKICFEILLNFMTQNEVLSIIKCNTVLLNLGKKLQSFFFNDLKKDKKY